MGVSVSVGVCARAKTYMHIYMHASVYLCEDEESEGGEGGVEI